MGYRSWQRLLLVELPVAVPVIAAGLRVAVVSNVSIVTMAALLGIPQLGSLFTQGFQLRLYVPLVTGVVLCVVLAVIFDGLIIWLNKLANPLAAKDGDIVNIIGWLTDPANWTGSDGIPTQIGYHLLYSAIALLVALAIAVPLGIAHRLHRTRRGAGRRIRRTPCARCRRWACWCCCSWSSRRWSPGKLVYVLPTIVVLVLLAVPPILTGTYAGIQNADPDAVGAARGMGYTKRQILLRVQLPCALPLMLSGVRSSTLQIVSTATIAAYLGLQGLGRFILDGRAQANFSRNGRRRNPRRRPRARARVRLRRGSAGSSSRPVCGAPRRSPPHQSPRPSPSRPPPRCHPAPTITSGESIMKKRTILSALAAHLGARPVRLRRRRGRPAVRRRGQQGIRRLRRSSSAPPTSPRAS